MQSTWAHAALFAGLALGGGVSRTIAHELTWNAFIDPETGAVCDAVNAGNLEFVVLSETGSLVVVTEDDYALDGAAFVNEEGIFYFEGIPLGQVVFDTDEGGFRTLWLLDLGGFVLELDPDTGQPIFTDHLPGDFVGVPCDAFDLWDDEDFDDIPDDFDDCPLVFGNDPSGCPCEEFDEDLDGVDNCFDLCPNTPLNTFVTEEGCPCNEFDEDDDGINDCFDDCPNTALGADVNPAGCEVFIVGELPPVTVVQPSPVFITCGNFSALTMAVTFGALMTLRLARRRFS